MNHINMCRVMRKPDFCLCENKCADQLCRNCTADQRLCFRYTDSTISILLKFEIQSFWPSSVFSPVSVRPTVSFLMGMLIQNSSAVTMLKSLTNYGGIREWFCLCVFRARLLLSSILYREMTATVTSFSARFFFFFLLSR